MIPFEEYLKRVCASLGPKLHAREDQLATTMAYITRAAGTENLQGTHRLLAHPHACFELSEVRGAGLDRADNWFYDRRQRVVIANMHPGWHDTLAGHLYDAYKDQAPYTTDSCLSGEAFLAEGMGWWLSSVMDCPHRDKWTRLDAQEQAAFRGIEFRLVEYKRPGGARREG